MWCERVSAVGPEAGDDMIRQQVSLPSGLPREGWKRETGTLVEISSERFPGSSPVWIWEE